MHVSVRLMGAAVESTNDDAGLPVVLQCRLVSSYPDRPFANMDIAIHTTYVLDRARTLPIGRTRTSAEVKNS
jgi:hypothetical protein